MFVGLAATNPVFFVRATSVKLGIRFMVSGLKVGQNCHSRIVGAALRGHPLPPNAYRKHALVATNGGPRSATPTMNYLKKL